MDCKPVRRNKTAFLYFYGVVWRGPEMEDCSIQVFYSTVVCLCRKSCYIRCIYVHVTAARALSVRSKCEMQS